MHLEQKPFTFYIIKLFEKNNNNKQYEENKKVKVRNSMEVQARKVRWAIKNYIRNVTRHMYVHFIMLLSTVPILQNTVWMSNNANYWMLFLWKNSIQKQRLRRAEMVRQKSFGLSSTRIVMHKYKKTRISAQKSRKGGKTLE